MLNNDTEKLMRGNTEQSYHFHTILFYASVQYFEDWTNLRMGILLVSNNIWRRAPERETREVLTEMHLSFYLIMPTIPRYFWLFIFFFLFFSSFYFNVFFLGFFFLSFSRLIFTHERVEKGAGTGQGGSGREREGGRAIDGQNKR